MTDQRNPADEAKQAFADHVAEPARKMAEGGAQVGIKMLDHAEQNTREAFAAMRSAANAKDVTEVMRIQGEFLRDAGSRGLAQAREIGEMIAQFGREVVKPIRGE